MKQVVERQRDTFGEFAQQKDWQAKWGQGIERTKHFSGRPFCVQLAWKLQILNPQMLLEYNVIN